MESCGLTFNKGRNNYGKQRDRQEEIKELLSHILNKLERLEQKIETFGKEDHKNLGLASRDSIVMY
jgi:archaellum component FlaC